MSSDVVTPAASQDWDWLASYARGKLRYYELRVEVAHFRLREDVRRWLMQFGLDCSDCAVDKVIASLSRETYCEEISRRT